MMNAKEILTTEDEKLADIVRKAFAGASNSTIKSVFNHWRILVEGKRPASMAMLVKAGSLVEIKPRAKKPENYVSSALYIKFEDKHFIVVIKPAGMLSSGDQSAKSPSAFTHMKKYHKENGGKEQLQIVHRLDKEVEGLMLFAKTVEAREVLKANWKQLTKTYLAITEGIPKEKEGVIESWIKDAEEGMAVVSSEKFDEEASLARTFYKVIQQVNGNAYVEVKLETGRKNQIRVHLSSLGTPIVGDWRYGADDTFQRQIRLAAVELQFTHPFTQEEVKISYNPPRAFFEIKDEDENYK